MDNKKSGEETKATTTNPKDILGSKKVPLSQIPAVALAHEACAMLDGSIRYGFRNWRAKSVQAHVYIDACLRHLEAWAEGEETASDSGVHHLGHARACLGILLDAQENGCLVDDRSRGKYGETMQRLNEWTTERVNKIPSAIPGNVVPIDRGFDVSVPYDQQADAKEDDVKDDVENCGLRLFSRPRSSKSSRDLFIGDRVRVRVSHKYLSKRVGRVVGFYATAPYAVVEFDQDYPCLHTCNGKVASGRGYNVSLSMLELYL